MAPIASRHSLTATLLLVVAGTVPLTPRPAAAQTATLERAETALRLGDLAAAERDFRALVEADSTDARAWLGLGSALQDAGETTEAVTAFDRAAAAGVQLPGLGYRRARALARVGRHDEAVQILARTAAAGAFRGDAPLLNENDFAPLRSLAAFEEVLETARASAAPCRQRPRNRELDFWIGDWDVYQNGQKVGFNSIQLILGECVLIENWTSALGSGGKSFNWVDRSSGPETWRQLWVSDIGGTLDYYRGELRDRTMVFEGHTLGQQGDTIFQQLSFVHVDDHTVEQIFATSPDRSTWTPNWRGLYIRRQD